VARLREYKTSKMKVINFKASRGDMKQIKEKADKYTEGNVSAWIRYAATQLEPKKRDLLPEPPPVPSDEDLGIE